MLSRHIPNFSEALPQHAPIELEVVQPILRAIACTGRELSSVTLIPIYIGELPAHVAHFRRQFPDAVRIIVDLAV